MSQPRPDARLYTRRLCQATHNRVQNESRGDLAGSDADQPYVGRRRAWSRVVGGPFGARRVITCSILAFTGCLLALSGVTTSFGHFDVLYAMAGVLAVGATPVTYSRVLATRGCKLQSARRPSHLSTRFRSAWIDCNGTSSRCGNRAAPVLPGTRDATKRSKLLGHIHVFQKVLLRGLHTACTAHTEPQLRALR